MNYINILNTTYVNAVNSYWDGETLYEAVSPCGEIRLFTSRKQAEAWRHNTVKEYLEYFGMPM